MIIKKIVQQPSKPKSEQPLKEPVKKIFTKDGKIVGYVEENIPGIEIRVEDAEELVADKMDRTESEAIKKDLNRAKSHLTKARKVKRNSVRMRINHE